MQRCITFYKTKVKDFSFNLDGPIVEKILGLSLNLNNTCNLEPTHTDDNYLNLYLKIEGKLKKNLNSASFYFKARVVDYFIV